MIPAPDRDQLQVFSVEDTAVQLTWGRLAPGRLAVRLDGADGAEFEVDGGPGALTLDGLAPGRTHRLTVEGSAVGSATRTLRVRTLDPPPGRELFRFATLSDLHLGTEGFDIRGRMREDPHPAGPHPERCARAALAAAVAWGAQRIVLKGDLTEASQPEEWERLGALLADVPVPVEVLPGNHDVHLTRGSLGAEAGAARAGIELRTGVSHLDVPGVRLVLIDSTVPPTDRGRLPAPTTARVAQHLEEAPGPAVALLHHHLRETAVPRFLPLGIPPRQAEAFLSTVAEANPATLITAGHSHRHRRRHVGPLVVTEVGSPKDYPGTWAGYVVHEGGIRQVVRRVDAPECLPWLERTRGAALGAWGRWSPGTLAARCFSHPWPAREPDSPPRRPT